MQGWIAAARETGGGLSRLVLSGREQLIVEGHSGLFSYETKCIRIRTRDGLITVSGKDLIIEYFGLQDLMIRGQVEAIGLSREEG